MVRLNQTLLRDSTLVTLGCERRHIDFPGAGARKSMSERSS